MTGDLTEWVMGLDGGGSKTAVALASRDGWLIGPFQGEGVNPFDQPRWLEVLTALVGRCPVPGEAIAHATFGLPGYGEVEAVSAAQREAVQGWGRAVTVVNDVQAAFEGALAGEAGVLVLSGTGSMAWGGDGRGRHVRVGGWGEGFGDEGSAYWIGQRALQRLSWALDGRLDDRCLREGVLEAIGVPDLDLQGLLTWYYTLEHPRSAVARLAEAVDGMAEAGCPSATAILEGAADLLLEHAYAARRLLDLGGPTQFSYAGSVFLSGTVRRRVLAGFERLGAFLEPRLSPLGGALLAAARSAGWSPSAVWLRDLRHSLEAR